jgi:hypothetical protein
MEADEIASARGIPMIEASDWTPVWAMPNIALDEPVEAEHAALVSTSDERLRSFADRRPGLQKFLSAFHDELGVSISPTIAMLRDGAPESVRTVPAFGGLRDAVCVSAIVAGRALTLKWKGPRGLRYSDAFDVYPWFPHPQFEGKIGAITPALASLHEIAFLQPQCAPALSDRTLKESEIDRPLLDAILARWENCFSKGNATDGDRRLFRALEMARAASRMPGGTDATFYDEGRAVALWVSAFEILAHDEEWGGPKQALTRLGQVQWLSSKLKCQDRRVSIGKKPFQTNLAGAIYERLNQVRNDFLHGNPVTPETLKLAKCQRSVLLFAGPLFRSALAERLKLPSRERSDMSDERDYDHIAGGMSFSGPQRLAEDAILMADEATDAGWVPTRSPPW